MAHGLETLAHEGLERLPPGYFDDKNGRSYRFYIAEDVVLAGAPAQAYTESERSYITGLYADEDRVALYVHSPWCVERCSYCYYWGKAEARNRMARLVAAEQQHARLVEGETDLLAKTVPSIYFGGGTPTVLPPDLLEETLGFYVERYGGPSCEVCCEASVSSLDPKKLAVLERHVTRLSLGVQSFDDGILRQVERTFTGAEAVELLEEVVPRFPSVNIDLIYGLQSQSLATWIHTVERAIELGVPSVTLYRLEVRDEAPLEQTWAEAPESFPDEIACLEMRRSAADLLEAAGYRENLLGWFLLPRVEDTVVYRERWERQTPCLAFGPNVHNYGADHYYYTRQDRDAYVADVESGRLPVESFFRLDARQALVWFVLAQWKSRRAADREVIERRFGGAAHDWLLAQLRDTCEWDLVAVSEREIALTRGGRSLCEWVLRGLIEGLRQARSTPVQRTPERVASVRP
jgi:oxygen-independent coproporphyrinogen-3 oxidase